MKMNLIIVFSLVLAIVPSMFFLYANAEGKSDFPYYLYLLVSLTLSMLIYIKLLKKHEERNGSLTADIGLDPFLKNIFIIIVLLLMFFIIFLFYQDQNNKIDHEIVMLIGRSIPLILLIILYIFLSIK